MSRIALIFVVMAAVALFSGGSLGAQVWLDTFDYPAGPTIGAWVKHLSTNWAATGTQVQAEPVAKYHHLTHPAYVYQDCVAEVDVDYNSSHGGLEFGGVILRANAPGQNTYGSDLVLVKVQGSSAFTITYLYEHSVTGGLGSTSKTLPSCTKARVRLHTIDQRVVARIDANRDGTWDVTVERNVSLPAKAGPVGICGYNGTFMDNYRIYNAVILEAQTGQPQPNPGTEYKMVIRGPAGDGYQAATSISTTGIVLPNGYVLPLTAETMMFASATNVLPTIFRNYQGFLDINGDASISLAIPALPVLTGLPLYTAFVAFKGSTVTAVSNDHPIVIQ